MIFFSFAMDLQTYIFQSELKCFNAYEFNIKTKLMNNALKLWYIVISIFISLNFLLRYTSIKNSFSSLQQLYFWYFLYLEMEWQINQKYKMEKIINGEESGDEVLQECKL